MYNHFNINKNFIYCISSLISIFSIGFSINYYRNYCYYHTFKNINIKFEQKELWEKELEIYSISMPKFNRSGLKKPKCILLISGYKDIPYIWKEFEKYLINDNYDYYAPRTFGNGRSFFQVVDWKDWVITYLEAIYILQEQYETIDIIGFSTGATIAVYLTQFKYKCKINNLFLCAPFLTYKKYLLIDMFFSKNYLSKILNKLYCWTFRFHHKSIYKTKKNIKQNILNEENNCIYNNDYCEIYGDMQMETVLFDFIKLKSKEIFVNNVIIIYPNNDNIIGNIYEQIEIIEKIFISKPLNIISIPSYLHDINCKNLPTKAGHILFKEKTEIINDVYINIKKFL
jgi:esterase/lipase